MSKFGSVIPDVSDDTVDAGRGGLNTLGRRGFCKNIDSLLNELLRASGADAAELFIKEPGSKRLWLAAHGGIAAREFQQKTCFELGSGFPGLVTQRGKPIMTQDLGKESDYLRSRVKSRGFRYYLCEPLPGRSGTTGSLNIASRDRVESIAESRSLVTALASRISDIVELDQMRAKEAVSSLPADPSLDAKRNLERKLNHALTAIVEFTNAQGGIVLLHDNETGTLHPWCWRGPYAGACTSIARSGRREFNCKAIANNCSIVAPSKPEGGPKRCKTAPCELGRVACLPLKVGSDLLGVVSVGYEDAYEPPGLLMSVLGSMVEQMALEVADAQASIVSEQRVTVARDLRLLGELNEVVERTLHPSIAHMSSAVRQSKKNVHQVRDELSEVKALLNERTSDIEDRSIPSSPESASGNGPEEMATVREATPFLDLRCFGKLTVFRDGQQIAASQFTRRRAAKLLKILLTNYGKPVHREMLIEMLWPEGHPRAAAKQLKVIAHDLRHVLQPEMQRNGRHSCIIWSEDGYMFDVASPHRLDSQDFLTMAQWGKRLEDSTDPKPALAAYQSAAALYTGDFLEDERYSDWCTTEREFFHETYLTMLRRTASLLLEQGDCEGAISSYRKAIRADGSLEDIHRELMRLLAESGRRNDALRQYQACCEMLQSELGCSPQAETVRLYKKIEAGA